LARAAAESFSFLLALVECTARNELVERQQFLVTSSRGVG
jgi:hypothetical protein